jgi:hypothetical protein
MNWGNGLGVLFIFLGCALFVYLGASTVQAYYRAFQQTLEDKNGDMENEWVCAPLNPPPTFTTEWDPPFTRFLIWLCARVELAMINKPIRVEDGGLELCRTLYNRDEATPMGVCCMDKEGVRYVALRGTDGGNMTELMRGISCGGRQVDVEKGKFTVHRGFEEVWASLKDQLIPFLLDAKEKVVFCGHSLGGAVAVLAALHLSRIKPELRLVVHTFGAPKSGDRNLRLAMYSHTWAMENLEDLIPSLPPASAPNPSDPQHPVIYYQPGRRLLFSDNRESMRTNHSLSTYYQNVYRAVPFPP